MTLSIELRPDQHYQASVLLQGKNTFSPIRINLANHAGSMMRTIKSGEKTSLENIITKAWFVKDAAHPLHGLLLYLILFFALLLRRTDLYIQPTDRVVFSLTFLATSFTNEITSPCFLGVICLVMLVISSGKGNLFCSACASCVFVATFPCLL